MNRILFSVICFSMNILVTFGVMADAGDDVIRNVTQIDENLFGEKGKKETTVDALDKTAEALGKVVTFFKEGDDGIVPKVSKAARVDGQKRAEHSGEIARDLYHLFGQVTYMDFILEQMVKMSTDIQEKEAELVRLDNEHKQIDKSILDTSEEIKKTENDLKALYEKEYLTELDGGLRDTLANTGQDTSFQELLEALQPENAPTHSSAFIEAAKLAMEESTDDGLELKDAIRIKQDLHEQFQELAKVREEYMTAYKSELSRTSEGLKEAEDKLKGGGLALKEIIHLRALIKLNNSNFVNYAALDELVKSDLEALKQAEEFVARNFVVVRKKAAWGEDAGEYFRQWNHGQMPTTPSIAEVSTPNAFIN